MPKLFSCRVPIILYLTERTAFVASYISFRAGIFTQIFVLCVKVTRMQIMYSNSVYSWSSETSHCIAQMKITSRHLTPQRPLYHRASKTSRMLKSNTA